MVRTWWHLDQIWFLLVAPKPPQPMLAQKNQKRDPDADQICSGIVIGLGTLFEKLRFEVGRERIFHTYANAFALSSAR